MVASQTGNTAQGPRAKRFSLGDIANRLSCKHIIIFQSQRQPTCSKLTPPPFPYLFIPLILGNCRLLALFLLFSFSNGSHPPKAIHGPQSLRTQSPECTFLYKSSFTSVPFLNPDHLTDVLMHFSLWQARSIKYQGEQRQETQCSLHEHYIGRGREPAPHTTETTQQNPKRPYIKKMSCFSSLTTTIVHKHIKPTTLRMFSLSLSSPSNQHHRPHHHQLPHTRFSLP